VCQPDHVVYVFLTVILYFYTGIDGTEPWYALSGSEMPIAGTSFIVDLMRSDRSARERYSDFEKIPELAVIGY